MLPDKVYTIMAFPYIEEWPTPKARLWAVASYPDLEQAEEHLRLLRKEASKWKKMSKQVRYKKAYRNKYDDKVLLTRHEAVLGPPDYVIIESQLVIHVDQWLGMDS